MISLDDSMSINEKQEFKVEAIDYAEKNSNHKAAEKFNAAAKWIKEWRQSKGGGRKPLNLQLENQLAEWI